MARAAVLIGLLLVPIGTLVFSSGCTQGSGSDPVLGSDPAFGSEPEVRGDAAHGRAVERQQKERIGEYEDEHEDENEAEEGLAGTDPATDPDEQDADYPCSRFVHAQDYLLRESLAKEAIGTFARLPSEAAQALGALVRDSALTTEVLVGQTRLLMALPAQHPLGHAELLLVQERSQLVYFEPISRCRQVLPASHLADLLEGAHPSRRVVQSLTLSSGSGEAGSGEAGSGEAGQGLALPGSRSLRMRELHAALTLRYEPGPGSRAAQTLKLDLTLLVADGPTSLAADEPLLRLALPLLQFPRGQPALETLAFALGRPLLAWSTRLTPENRTASLIPESRVIVYDRGPVRIPRCRLSMIRRGYKDSDLCPGLERPGVQRLSEAQVGSLRPGREVGELTVENRTGASAMVVVDGVLVGWVAAKKRMVFKGFKTGFYRVFARSPQGIRTHGPLETYIPGPMVLR